MGTEPEYMSASPSFIWDILLLFFPKKLVFVHDLNYLLIHGKNQSSLKKPLPLQRIFPLEGVGLLLFLH